MRSHDPTPAEAAMSQLINVGQTDRFIRLGLAVIFTYLAGRAAFAGTVTLIFWALAVLLTLTAVFRICPLYRLFGISTDHKAVAAK
jgi:hypothetical protein